MSEFIRKFNVPTYSSASTYYLRDVVKVVSSGKEYYFVSVQAGHASTLDTSLFQSNSYWKRFDDPNLLFSDVWSPSYSTMVMTEQRVRDGSMNDGCTKISPDGINTSILNYSLTFESVSDQEAFSLLCFLDFMGSKRAFKWAVPPPYDNTLSFNFVSSKHTFNKKNDNTISVEIRQSFVIYGVGAGQEKLI